MKKLLLFLFISTVGFSQSVYKGNISEGGISLPGATICVANTKRCVTSDLDGNYSIEVIIGDVLTISFIGMKPKSFKITTLLLQQNGEKVNRIISSDYADNIKKSKDSAQATKPSGRFEFNLLNGLGNDDVMKIVRNEDGLYRLKKKAEYNKISFEMSQEFTYSNPIRLPKYQTTYAQGRSINGETVYQSPETNEIFSWGPNVNSLVYSGNKSEYYPQGAIVNKYFGNDNYLQLYDPNTFFQNPTDNKFSFASLIESPKGNFLKINFIYKTGAISIPMSRNNEVTTSLKYFRNVSKNSNIEALFSYNDFENNLTNSNFGINKIVFANAITPIHFNNNFSSTLSNGLQRSFSVTENNPYYLIDKNLDKNKSKTISSNFNYKYKENKNSNEISAIFQFSEIANTNGQNFYFAGINAPNFNERIEKYKIFSASDVFRRELNSDKFIETKIGFRYQDRRLERNYFSGYTTANDFPDNILSQSKLDISQQRVEGFYNLNGGYNFPYFFDNYEELILKANTGLIHSSTAKEKLLPNFGASAELRNLFDRKINFNVSYAYSLTEPSLQNNNLNFNSLQYQLKQFIQLQNNLELITPKQGIATKEDIINLGLVYKIDYKWNFNINYYSKKVANLYVPIFDLNSVKWSPEVNYKQNGIEAEIEKANYYYHNLSYGFNVNFTYYKNEVTSLNGNQSRIPFAGFSDVNKNYIVGQPLGVIVGNGYLRDANQNVIIDQDGFPFEDTKPKILGNPNPDFVVGFYNTVRYKDFSFNISFDWSQGGEIWNGTQQTLNYYGKSEITEKQRNTTNYVFDGVTESGLANTKSVSFYDPNLPVEQNRWTRYGVDGVAEDAIESATYFRLNSINLSYTKQTGYLDNKLFVTISLFMNNVFILSKNKSAFTSNSMFNSAETSGLDYFNSPMMRSFGSSLTIKF